VAVFYFFPSFCYSIIADFFISQPALFERHELSPVHEGPVQLGVAHPVWLFAVMLAMTALVVLARIFYRKNISELIRAFLSMSVTNQLVRDENILLQRASLILTMLFDLTAAFMVWQFGSAIAYKLPFVLNDFNRFLFFAFIITLIYSFKYMVLKITGYIFGTEQETDAYIFNIFLCNNLFGMFMFPLAVLLFLYPQLSESKILFIALVVIASGFFVYRILRGIFIGRASPSFSAMYLFLYICAIEFAPLVVLLKVASPQ
jgi:hypothetical protein